MRLRNPRGFTLIETLIALVVAATAAAVILSMVRGLRAGVEQEHAHEWDVLRLINDSLRLAVVGVDEKRVVLEPKATDQLLLRFDAPELPRVVVRNFSVTVPRVPPITLAYTPLQQFSLEQGIYTLTVIGPSLSRPDMILPRSKQVAEGSQAEGSQGVGKNKIANDANAPVSR